ncbi:alcohol dehydrogenase catalytic domain-containing protein [Aquimarina celericrescens]|uniref:Alcohol dehydrogenase catalytic domain-containing protein n=1 Tax=Aquimarina celericrescens TaxID=1964542 RepID=A0ABW5AYB7_9FLAO|nr:alcohol dehydrogenase catalytic domain-containing protein [Aquimarina celericrescens]
MKAVVFKKYGSPQKVLTIKEVARPTSKENEVLIKIKATTVNDYDRSFVRGKPYLYRLMYGLLKPKHPISGMELSGLVENVGYNVGYSVKKLKVGDAVFGVISSYGFGTFAEYISIHENTVIKKPDKLSFEEAAAIPHASRILLKWKLNLKYITIMIQGFFQMSAVLDKGKTLIKDVVEKLSVYLR